MSRRSVWVIQSVVMVLVVLGLGYTANYRYANGLVHPGMPLPDYSIQAATAYIGMVVVVVAALVLTLRVTRRASPSAAAVAGASAIIVAGGVILAFFSLWATTW